jgi:hypothetical protein
MPIIEVPGHGQVEFPDGMSDDEIVSAIKKSSMAEPPKPSVSNLERFMQGLKDPIDAGAQLLTKMLPEGIVKAGNTANNWLADKTGLVGRLPEGGIDQQVKETGDKFKTDGVDWSRMAGNVLSPANLAIASKLPAAASLTGRVAQGAVGGAAMGALTPVTGGDFTEEKLGQIGTSAAFGGALPAVTGGLSRLISPKASLNPELALLKSEGVNPTLGQTLGGRFNTVEEKLTSVPILGDAISSARRKAQEQFNSAAINRATSPIGEKVENIGQQGVKEAGDLLSGTYEQAISKLKYVKFDNNFATDLSQLKSMATGLEPKFERKFNELIKTKLGSRTSPNGSMFGDKYKNVMSDLGDEARTFEGMSSSGAVDYADAVKQLKNLMQIQISRGGNKEAAELNKAADKGWANIVRVEGASKSAMNSNGVFTPAQLNMAVRQGDSSVRDRATARGTALMQDLGNAGQNVIGNKVPNSFTTDRALMSLGSLGSYAVNPAIPAALVGGAAMYSPLAQKALNAAITSRPQIAQSVAKRVRNSSPYLIPAGAGLLND